LPEAGAPAMMTFSGPAALHSHLAPFWGAARRACQRPASRADAARGAEGAASEPDRCAAAAARGGGAEARTAPVARRRCAGAPHAGADARAAGINVDDIAE
jgi:hypothetical protein